MCKGSVLLGFLFLSFVSQAQTDRGDGDYVVTANNLKGQERELSFRVNILSENDSCLKIFIHNPEKKKLQLTIIHSVTGYVADTIIEGDEYACRYNFSNADDGKYKVIVRNGKEKFTKEIELNTVTIRNLQLR